MSFELFFRRGRSSVDVVTLYEADDNGLTLNVGDVVRFKVFRRNNQTPVLDVDSVGALSGGSLVTVNQTASAAEVQILIAQGDVGSLLGTYSASIEVVDTGDSNRIKIAEDGQVTFLPSGGGDVGIT